MAYIETPMRHPELTQDLIDKEIDRWLTLFTDGMIMRNHYDTEKSLDADWIKFMDQCYEHKCLANNMAYRFYGMTNQEMYYKLKRYFLKNDDIGKRQNNLITYAPPNSKVVNEDSLDMDRRADIITRSTGYYVLKNNSKDLDDLNNQIYKFRSMPADKKAKADTISIQIYGKKNEERYNEMMPEFLRNMDVEDEDNEEIIYDASTNEAVLIPKFSTYENNTLNTLEAFRHGINESTSISEAVVLFNEAMKIETESPLEENMKKLIHEAIDHKIHIEEDTEDYLGMAPGLLLEEMEELGVYGDEQDIFKPTSTKMDSNPRYKWLVDYQDRCIGLRPARTVVSQDWKNTILSLYDGLMNADKEEDKNKYRVSLLEYGWNPAMDPNTQLREASDRTNKIFRDNLNYRFIDLTEMVGALGMEDGTDTVEKIPTKGIFVIFPYQFQYEPFSSDIAKAYISTDPYMKIIRPLNRFFFSTTVTLDELLRHANDNYQFCINVYYIKFPESMYNDLREMWKFLGEKSSDFRFRYSIITGIINRLETKDIANQKLFCAKILDMILYAVIYGYKDPGAYLSINMLSSMVGRNTKNNVYRVYGGEVSMYDGNRINKMISLDNIDDYFDDSYSQYVSIKPMNEVATLPVDFDKDGALLIRRKAKIDFASEYSRTHKLLMQYSKAKGYEAMKYHVAKLWYLNILIEKRIHNPQKISKEDLSKCYKTRAHILSDFKQYMGEILSQEPNFDFNEYYSQTPFDKSTLKISKGMLDRITSLAKSILNPIKEFILKKK